MAASINDVPPGTRSCLTRVNMSLLPDVAQSVASGSQQAPREFGAIMKDYMWDQGQTITIGFLEGSPEQQDFVKKTVLESWQPLINLKLKFVDSTENAMIRVSFNQTLGAWSYIGTQNKNIPANQPTLNLGWLDNEPGKFGGVVKHEFGHMLGFAHEHLRSDAPFEWNKPAVENAFQGPPNNWSPQTIQTNIFDTINTDQFIGTDYDPKSIMVYIFDCSLFNYKPPNMSCSTGSNQMLSQDDKATVSTLYPKSGNLGDLGGLTGDVIKDTGGFEDSTSGTGAYTPPPGTGTGTTIDMGTDQLSWMGIFSIVFGVLIVALLIAIGFVARKRKSRKPRVVLPGPGRMLPRDKGKKK